MDSKKLFTTTIAAAVAATAVVPATFAADPTPEEVAAAAATAAKGILDAAKEITVAADKVTDKATLLTAIKALDTETDATKKNTAISGLTDAALTIADGKVTVKFSDTVSSVLTIKAEPVSAAKLLLDGKTILLTEAQYAAYKATAATDEITEADITAAKEAVLAAIAKFDTATTDATKNAAIKALADTSIVKAADSDKLTVTLKAATTDPVAAAVTATINVATVAIQNNGVSADTVTVKGLAANDVVKVYDVEKDGKAIGTAKATADGAKVSIKKLDTAKALYISITPAATPKEEGLRFGGFTVGPVEQTKRGFSAEAINKAGAKKDVVTVLGLKAKDVVNVYSKYTEEVVDGEGKVTTPAKLEGLIGTAKVSKAGAIDVKIKDGFASSLTEKGETDIYVTVTELDKGESAPLEVYLYPEHQSFADEIEVVANNAAGAKNDTITLYDVKAKDIINIYSKATVTEAVEGTPENPAGTPASTKVSSGDLVQTIKVSKDAAFLNVKVKDKAKVGFTVLENDPKDGGLQDTNWYYTRQSLDELESEPVAFEVPAEQITEDRFQKITFTNNIKARDTLMLSGGKLAVKDVVKVYNGALDATTAKPAKPVVSVAVKQANSPVVLTVKEHKDLGTVFTYSITKANERESFGLSAVVGRTEQSDAVNAPDTLLNDNGEKAATLTVVNTLPKAVYTVYDGTTEIGKASAKGGILNIALKGKKYADLKTVTVTVTEVDHRESQKTVVRDLDGNSVATLEGLATLLGAANIEKVDGPLATQTEVALLQDLEGITAEVIDGKAKLTSYLELDKDGQETVKENVVIKTEDVAKIAALELVTNGTVFDASSDALASIKAADAKNTVLQKAELVSINEATQRAKVKIGGTEVIVPVDGYKAPTPPPLD